MTEFELPVSPDDENDPMADQRAIVDQIEDYLEQGKQAQAKSLLTRRWRDLVPELPLRFSVVLEQPRAADAFFLGQRLKAGSSAPRLLITEEEGALHVKIARGAVLGRIPADDAEFLRSVGDDAKLYELHVLEIREGGSVVAVEFVRPELRTCSFCGKRHSEPHVNCAECRKKRRPKDPEAVGADFAPVLLSDALEAIVEADQADDEDDDTGGKAGA